MLFLLRRTIDITLNSIAFLLFLTVRQLFLLYPFSIQSVFLCEGYRRWSMHGGIKKDMIVMSIIISSKIGILYCWSGEDYKHDHHFSRFWCRVYCLLCWYIAFLVHVSDGKVVSVIHWMMWCAVLLGFLTENPSHLHAYHIGNVNSCKPICTKFRKSIEYRFSCCVRQQSHSFQWFSLVWPDNLLFAIFIKTERMENGRLVGDHTLF